MWKDPLGCSSRLSKPAKTVGLMWIIHKMLGRPIEKIHSGFSRLKCTQMGLELNASFWRTSVLCV